MKIIASKIDDLRRQKQARADHKKWYDSQTNKMWNDQYQVSYKPIEDYLKENLAKYDLLDLSISVEGYWTQVKVRIHNESQTRDENAALAWNYDVDLNLEGNKYRDMAAGVVKRETSSWSGLSAITDAQIAHLEQCVEAIKWLNNVDWDDILHRALSEAQTFSYDDYHNDNKYDGDMDFDDKMDYDAEIIAEQLRELVGRTDVLVKTLDDGYGYYRPRYYMIKKETPKFFIANNVSASVVEDEDVDVRETTEYKWALDDLNPIRLKKESLDSIFSDPIEVVEI